MTNTETTIKVAGWRGEETLDRAQFAEKWLKSIRGLEALTWAGDKHDVQDYAFVKRLVSDMAAREFNRIAEFQNGAEG